MASKNLEVISNPLCDVNLTRLRDKKTSHSEFREIVDRLSSFLAYECSKDIKTVPRKIHTPLAPYIGKQISGEIVLVPILRAGLGLINGFLNLMPTARVAHIGLYRNEETLEPIEYYFKFPTLKNISSATVIILDPMLATGGSVCAAIDKLKKKKARKIIVASIVSAPEGISMVHTNHPNVKIITCALDKKLNKVGYIVPGLGDAGDRIFGTK